MFCDLHTHSTASDGTTPSDELATLARHAGLAALALTDHDTTQGLVDCQDACEAQGIAFVPGIEVSADPHLSPRDVSDTVAPRRGTLHILGLFVRHDDKMLAGITCSMTEARDTRNPAIVEKLNELGLTIDYSEVRQLAAEQGTRIIGRPHIAQVLILHGHVDTFQQAFTRYIGYGAPAYVRRDRLAADQAIEAIHHAGGLAILAHPVQLQLSDCDMLLEFVQRLKNIGLDGIETRHSDHSMEDIEQFEKLASHCKLLTTGGSDFHGHRKPTPLASQHVPIQVYEQLRDAHQQRT